jgi:hypothetical protein
MAAALVLRHLRAFGAAEPWPPVPAAHRRLAVAVRKADPAALVRKRIGETNCPGAFLPQLYRAGVPDEGPKRRLK